MNSIYSLPHAYISHMNKWTIHRFKDPPSSLSLSLPPPPPPPHSPPSLFLFLLFSPALSSSPFHEDWYVQLQSGGLSVGCLLAQHPSNLLVYIRDASAQTFKRAATPRQKMQVKLAISPGHSILAQGQPVLARTPQYQALG